MSIMHLSNFEVFALYYCCLQQGYQSILLRCASRVLHNSSLPWPVLLHTSLLSSILICFNLLCSSMFWSIMSFSVLLRTLITYCAYCFWTGVSSVAGTVVISDVNAECDYEVMSSSMLSYLIWLFCRYCLPNVDLHLHFSTYWLDGITMIRL